MNSTIDQQFVEFVVKSLVGNPDAVSVERTVDEKGVLLELTVDPEDLGRVIGKRGATAQSLRTLLRALGTKNEARYNLKIIDNGEPRPERVERTDAPADSSSYDDNAHGDATLDGPQASAKPVAADDDEPLPTTPAVDDHSEALSRARKELAELDDLDI